jgi:hypothetical protein
VENEKKKPRLWPNVAYRTVGCTVNLLKLLAGTTGLEPATSCVTGMRSNQLNYVPNLLRTLTAEPHLCRVSGRAGTTHVIAQQSLRQVVSRKYVSLMDHREWWRYAAPTDELLLVRQAQHAYLASFFVRRLTVKGRRMRAWNAEMYRVVLIQEGVARGRASCCGQETHAFL